MTGPRFLDRILNGNKRVPAALMLWKLASQRATFGPVHRPPSSGGVLSRSFSEESASLETFHNAIVAELLREE